MQNKNILHIVTNLGDGGLEKIVYTITHNIKHKHIKHFVSVLIKSEIIFLNDDFIKDNIQPRNFAFRNRFENFHSLKNNILETIKLAKYIKLNRINIIHSHDFFPAFVARTSAIFSLLIFFYKTDKIIITLHNSFFWLKPVHHLTNKLLSFFTTKIVCVSKSVMDFSIKNDKITKTKYQIIYNGVDVDNFKPNKDESIYYRNKLGIKTDDIVIGNIGVLSVRKGQKYLIKSVIKLVKLIPNIRLLIFGSERPHEIVIANEIYSLIEENNLQNYVDIIEPTKEINKIYNIFDIFVMPSITEGLSLCAIEAMLMKRICLFSDIPSFKELIRDGNNGFLFQNKNADDLFDKLVFILNNYKSLEHIGFNARDYALKSFDSLRMCNEYRNLYLN